MRTRVAVSERHERRDWRAHVIHRGVIGRLSRDGDLPRVYGERHAALSGVDRVRGEAGVQRDRSEAVRPLGRHAAKHVGAGEAGDERVSGARDELRRRGDLEQTSVDEDPDAIGERGRVVEVVRHDHRRQRELLRGAPLAPCVRAPAYTRRAPRAARRAGGPPDPSQALGRARPADAPRRRSPQAGHRRDGRSGIGRAARPHERGLRTPRWRGRSGAGRARIPGRRGQLAGARAERRFRSTCRASARRRGARRRCRAGASPAIARSTLDLPAPEGPTSATVSEPSSSASESWKERRP